MPVEFNVFKRIAENAHDDSFIRMSQSTPGTIVNFGTSFLGRKLGWYRHATAAQNQDIREQLYQAIEKAGSKIQSDTMARIRLQLGINDQGKSSLTTQLSAREVKRIFADIETDNANFKARKDFAEQLRTDYGHDTLTALVSQRLGMNDPKESIKPLTEELKNAILQEVKTAGIAFFNAKKAEIQLPDIATIRTWISDAQELKSIEDTLARCAEGKVPYSGLTVIKGKINGQRLFSLKPQIEAKFLQQLEQLKVETGVDCIAGKDAMLEYLLYDLDLFSGRLPTVISDPSVLNDAIDEKIDALLQKRKALIMGIKQADPKLDPAVEKSLIEIAVTDMDMKSPKVALVLAKYISMAGDLYEYSREPNPKMADFLAKISNWEVKFDAAAQECKKVYTNFGADDLLHVNDWIVSIAKASYKAKYGVEPQMTPQIKQLLETYISELLFIQNNPNAGMDDHGRFFAYSPSFAKENGCIHYFKLAEATALALGGGINYDPDPAEGISFDVGNFMSHSGCVARRYPHPYDRVIDQNLGSAFMDTFIQEFKHAAKLSQKSSMVDYTKMFYETARDMGRSGIGLKLGNKVISYAGKTGMEGNGIAEIQKFFEEDGDAGINAARVLSGILCQSAALNCTKSLMVSGEACGGNFAQISSYALNLNVTRQQNGLYFIDFEYDLVPAMHMQDGASTPTYLDQNRSRLSMKFTLQLGIIPDNKSAILELHENARIHSELHKLVFTPEEYIRILSLKDKDTGDSIANEIIMSPELAHDAHLKQMLAEPPETMDRDAISDYVKDKIINVQDKNVLYALGFSEAQIEELTFGLAPEARLTKALMNRLTGPDLAEREAAFNELKALCQKLVDRGWQPPMDFNLDDMALATVGGLKMDKDMAEHSEIAITRAYIKASKDEELSTLPAALSSNSPQRVAFAKARLKAAVVEARRALGVDLLKTLEGEEEFSSEQIEILRTAPDQARIQKYLENIVLKNEEVEPSIRVLKSYVEALKIMNA